MRSRPSCRGELRFLSLDQRLAPTSTGHRLRENLPRIGAKIVSHGRLQRASPLDLAGCGKTRRLEKIAQKSARNQKSGPVKSMGYLNAEGHGLLRKQHRPTFSVTC